jgi:hypothetical protein
MAALRNLAIGALRMAGRIDVTEATRWAGRSMAAAVRRASACRRALRIVRPVPAEDQTATPSTRHVSRYTILSSIWPASQHRVKPAAIAQVSLSIDYSSGTGFSHSTGFRF